MIRHVPKLHGRIFGDYDMLGRFLAVIAGIGGIVIGSQAPNFTAHFMQNLEGRVDELLIQVQDINADREKIGMTRNMAKAACEAADTQVLKDDCDRAEETLVRFDTLQALQAELHEANVWKRPVVLGEKIGTDEDVRTLAENVTKEFKPAIPTTADGAGYAAGFGAVFWAFFRVIFMILGLPFRPRY